MSRTIVDIPKQQIEALDRLRSKQHVTRASLIREAIAAYLTTHDAGLAEAAFGVWRDKPRDALAYEHELRSEWSK
ncbi:MAG: ribbon-helix-helix domain-containing protein [Verrucomicrobia bacterium]|nr:ribbon-helix-helix domain-containing protein [Verrucomicrobiota bacterium]